MGNQFSVEWSKDPSGPSFNEVGLFRSMNMSALLWFIERIKVIKQTEFRLANKHERLKWKDYFALFTELKDMRKIEREKHQRDSWHPATNGYLMKKDGEIKSTDNANNDLLKETNDESKIEDDHTDDEPSIYSENGSENNDNTDNYDKMNNISKKEVIKEQTKQLAPTKVLNSSIISPIFFGYSSTSSLENDTEQKEEQKQTKMREARAILKAKESRLKIIEAYEKTSTSKQMSRLKKMETIEAKYNASRLKREAELKQKRKEMADFAFQLYEREWEVQNDAAEDAFDEEMDSLQFIHDEKTKVDRNFLLQKREELDTFQDAESQEIPTAEKLEAFARIEISRSIDELDKLTDQMERLRLEYKEMKEDFQVMVNELTMNNQTEDGNGKPISKAQNTQNQRAINEMRSMVNVSETRMKEAKKKVETAFEELLDAEVLLERAVRIRKQQDELLPLFKLLSDGEQVSQHSDQMLKSSTEDDSFKLMEPQPINTHMNHHHRTHQHRQSVSSMNSLSSSEQQFRDIQLRNPLASCNLNIMIISLTILIEANFEQKYQMIFHLFKQFGEGFYSIKYLTNIVETAQEAIFKLKLIRHRTSHDAIFNQILRGFTVLGLNPLRGDCLTDYETKRLLIQMLSFSRRLCKTLGLRLENLTKEMGIVTDPFPNICSFPRGYSYYMSTYQRNQMSAIGLLSRGMIDTPTAAYRIYRESYSQYKPQLDPLVKQELHRRALNMGLEDPSRADYTKFIVKPKKASSDKILPLDHGHLTNVYYLHYLKRQEAATKIQAVFRSFQDRKIALLAAKHLAFMEAKQGAIQEMKTKVVKEFRKRESNKGMGKMKWDANVRMRQAKIRAQGQSVSRTDTVMILMEEAINVATQDIEKKFEELMRRETLLGIDFNRVRVVSEPSKDPIDPVSIFNLLPIQTSLDSNQFGASPNGKDDDSVVDNDDEDEEDDVEVGSQINPAVTKASKVVTEETKTTEEPTTTAATTTTTTTTKEEVVDVEQKAKDEAKEKKKEKMKLARLMKGILTKRNLELIRWIVEGKPFQVLGSNGNEKSTNQASQVTSEVDLIVDVGLSKKDKEIKYLMSLPEIYQNPVQYSPYLINQSTLQALLLHYHRYENALRAPLVTTSSNLASDPTIQERPPVALVYQHEFHLDQLFNRLCAMHFSLTSFKIKGLLSEFPSKRLFMRYIKYKLTHGTTPEEMASDLRDYFRFKINSIDVFSCLKNLLHEDLEQDLLLDAVIQTQSIAEPGVIQLFLKQKSDALAEFSKGMELKLKTSETAKEDQLVNDELNRLLNLRRRYLRICQEVSMESEQLRERNQKALLSFNEVDKKFMGVMDYKQSMAKPALTVQEKLVIPPQLKQNMIPMNIRYDWMRRFKENLMDFSNYDAASGTDTDDVAQSSFTHRLTTAREICTLGREFFDTALADAIIIVRELHQPKYLKTIPVCEEWKVNGRSEHCGRGIEQIDTSGELTMVQNSYEAHGIIYQVCLDYDGVFNGSDEFAAKAGGKDRLNSLQYLKLCIPGLHVPLQMTIDYMGYRIIASTKLPTKTVIFGEEESDVKKINEELLHGIKPQSRGDVFLNSSRVVQNLLKSAATKLNLAGHYCRGFKDIAGSQTFASVDLLVFKGIEASGKNKSAVDAGEYCAKQFWKAYPPEIPIMTPHLTRHSRDHSIFWRYLRPEFVHRYDKPLSPDACCILNEQSGRNEQLIQYQQLSLATSKLIQELVPNFLKELLMYRKYSLPLDAGLGIQLNNELHAAGINIRHIGIMRSHLWRPLPGTMSIYHHDNFIRTTFDLRNEVNDKDFIHINGALFQVQVEVDESDREDPNANPVGKESSIFDGDNPTNLLRKRNKNTIQFEAKGEMNEKDDDNVKSKRDKKKFKSRPITHDQIPISTRYLGDSKNGLSAEIGRTLSLAKIQSHVMVSEKVSSNKYQIKSKPFQEVQQTFDVFHLDDANRNISLLLLSEMLCRTVKCLIRYQLREYNMRNKITSESFFNALIVEYLNYLTGASSKSNEMFQHIFFEGIRERFGVCAIRESERLTYHRDIESILVHTISTILRFVGVQLTMSCINEFYHRPKGFLFTSADILNTRPVVKHNIFLLPYAEATVLSLEASILETKTYQFEVMKDHPNLFYTFSERKGNRKVKNLGELGSVITGDISGCLMELEGPIVSDRFIKSFGFEATSESTLTTKFHEKIIPTTMKSHFTAEVFVCCSKPSKDSNQVILTCGRYTVFWGRDNHIAVTFADEVHQVSFKVPTISPVDAQPDAAGKDPALISNDIWTHIAITFDGTSLRCYIDGLLQSCVEVESILKVKELEAQQKQINQRKGFRKQEKEEKLLIRETAKSDGATFFQSRDGVTYLRKTSQAIMESTEFQDENIGSDAKDAQSELKIKKLEALKRAKEKFIEDKYLEYVREITEKYKVLEFDLDDRHRREVEEGKLRIFESFRIGASNPTMNSRVGSNYFCGKISCVALYSSCLPADRIRIHYESSALVDKKQDALRLHALAVDRYESGLLNSDEEDVRCLRGLAYSLCSYLRGIDSSNATIHSVVDSLSKRLIPPGSNPTATATQSNKLIRDITMRKIPSQDRLSGKNRLIQIIAKLKNRRMCDVIAEIIKQIPKDPEYAEVVAVGILSIKEADSVFFSKSKSLTRQDLVNMPFDFGLTHPHNPVNQLQAASIIFQEVVKDLNLIFIYGEMDLRWLPELNNPYLIISIVKHAMEDKHLKIIRIAEMFYSAGFHRNVQYDALHPDQGTSKMVKEGSDKSDTKPSEMILVSDNDIQVVCHYVALIEGLDLSKCGLLTDSIMSHIIRLKNIKLLNLDYCPLITDKGLMEVSVLCPKLEVLSLEGNTQLSDEGLHLIADKCKKLKLFNANHCHQVSFHLLNKIIRNNSKRLQTFHISMLSIQDDDLSQLCSSMITNPDVVQNSQSKLKLSNSIEIVTLNVVLTSLDLSFCRNIGDFGVITLSQTCPSLQYLNLCGLSRVTDRGVASVCTNCWYLKYLNLEDVFLVRDDGFRFNPKADGRPAANQNMMKSLQCLNLTDCVHLTDYGIEGLAERCRKLELLNLRGCEKLTDGSLRIMASATISTEFSIPMIDSIKTLILSNCSGFTGPGLLRLFPAAACLQELDLSGLSSVVNDAFIHHLCQVGRTLQSIILQRCILITDASLCSMSESLWLEKCDVTGCGKLTDEGVEVLTEACTGLTVLKLRKVHRITNRSVEFIKRNCSIIEQLDIRECDLISKDCVQDLRLSHHQLLVHY